jgi:eukaryotic-like serine/threonine-protein kinase
MTFGAMALPPGSRVGQYEIVGSLGAGGMGEVYRARDMRLHRDVAIKVLPDAFAQDAERRARFEREARTLASLNHPNIAQIHGLEEAPAEAGVNHRALVMELVEGPTLATVIGRAPLPSATRSRWRRR